MFDFDKLSYNKADGYWILPGDIEIIVAGDPNSADVARIEFARHVVANLEKVTDKALWYLDGFVDAAKWPFDKWDVSSLEFGVPADEPHFSFNVVLLNGADVYFRWSVSICNMPTIGFSPDGFSVNNW